MGMGHNILEKIRLATDGLLTITRAGAVTLAGALKSSSPTGGIGYATGAGGAVTQDTSKATPVTLSKMCGTITTHAASLNAAAEVTFTVTNTLVEATDVIVACIASGGTSGSYTITCGAVAAGSFDLTLGNVSAGALAEAVVINFAVIKAVAA